jgi:sugar phosphate isomerase/epimerase
MREELMYSRRAFGRIALAAFPAVGALAKINSKIDGVQIGAQSYSFRDRPLDAAIQAMVECGLGECELAQVHVEPKEAPGTEGREALRKWRLSVSLDEFKSIRKKFDTAGIQLYAYNLSFNDSFTDEEIDRGFLMAKALGVGLVTASSTLTAAKRVVPYAAKHKIKVAMHGHDNVKDPNQFAKPESFAEALEMSPYFFVNLDIGHFFTAGYDPVAYLQEHHDRIVDLHLKDRKPNHGEGTPFGQGGVPIKDVLLLLKKNKWPIPANIEYEYKGQDAVAEVKKCFQYCKDVLA